MQTPWRRLRGERKKALLVDAFSKTRGWNFAFLLLIVIAYYLALRFDIAEDSITNLAFFELVFGNMIFNLVNTRLTLKSDGFSFQYIRTYLLISWIQMVAFLSMMTI